MGVTNGEGSKFTGTWVLDERSKDADQPGYKLADGDKFYYYAQMDSAWAIMDENYNTWASSSSETSCFAADGYSKDGITVTPNYKTNDSKNNDSTNNDSTNSDSTNSDSTNTATNVASTKKTTDAQAEVINCNDETTKAVQIKAGVTNPTNDFDAASGWTKDPDNSARWIKTYALADLGNPEFIKEGEEDWMVLTATEGTTGCEKIKVDGVDICKDIGESYSFKCKYNLKDQTIKDTFSVTGQDTEVDAEGIGELSYT